MKFANILHPIVLK